MGTGQAEKELCVMCKNEINAGAKKCTECDSYQKLWRRAIPFSTSVLAMLVALVSVTGVMAKPIREAFTAHDSDIYAAYLAAEKDKLWLFVSNRGTRTGAIAQVFLTEPGGESRSLHIGTEKFFAPGKTDELVLFSPDPIFPKFDPQDEDADHCLIEVFVRNFSGRKSQPQKINIPCRAR